MDRPGDGSYCGIIPVTGVLLGLLVVLAAAPLPVILPGMHGLGGPQLLWPAIALVAGGAVALVAAVLQVSRPLGCLTAYLLLRAAWTAAMTPDDGIVLRTALVLVQALGGIGVYALVAHRPALARGALVGFVGAAAFNLTLGLEDMLGIHAWQWRQTQVAHLPHGWLQHPNHWGLFMAMAVPVAWWMLSRRTLRWAPLVFIPGLVVVASSRSIVAIIATVVVGLLVLRRTVPAIARLRVVTMAGLTVAACLPALLTAYAVRAHLLAGRWTVWRVAGDALTGWPAFYQAFGAGLGSWRLWALHPEGPIVRGSPAHGHVGQGAMAGFAAGLHITVQEHLIGALVDHIQTVHFFL